MRFFLPIFILIIVLNSVTIASADTWSDWGIDSFKNQIPDIWVSAFDENTQIMGENYDSFSLAFQKLDSIDKKKAAVFLIAFMPLVDIVAMDSQTFVNNIDYAFKARNEFPWGKDYDDNIFYHYVLPHRVTQEPIADFRPFFYNELKDELKDLTSLAEAAVMVNKWCDNLIGFKPTQRRDQGPFETLKSGYGRCEEMMIFYVDAARSVGIPARQAYTPFWAHSDNNHAWAEVFANGRWNYLGACEYADQLNQAWFRDPVRRAALVISTPFGLPDLSSTNEEVSRYADSIPDKFAMINSTKFYTDPGYLNITLLDLNNQPVPDGTIFVYVFNFGALRPIVRLTSDHEGKASLTIGEGRFYVSGGTESNGGGKLFNIRSNQNTNITIITNGEFGLKEFNWVRPAKIK